MLCGIPPAAMPAITSKAMLCAAIICRKPSITICHCAGQNGKRRLSTYTGDLMPDLKVTGACGVKTTAWMSSSARATCP